MITNDTTLVIISGGNAYIILLLEGCRHQIPLLHVLQLMNTIGLVGGAAIMQVFIVEMPNITQLTINITESEKNCQQEIWEKSSEMAQYAFMVPGLVSMAAAVYYIGLCITLPSIDIAATKHSSTSNTKDGRKRFDITVWILIFICMFGYFQKTQESILGHYLTVFTLSILDTSAHYAAMVTTVFFSAFCVSRAAGICISYFLNPEQMLWINLTLGAAAYAVMLLVPTYQDIPLIISSILAGLSLAASYGSLVLWSTNQFPDTIKMNSLVYVGGSLAGISILPGAGYLIDHIGEMWMVYILFSANTIMMILFFVMNVLVKYFLWESDIHKSSVK